MKNYIVIDVATAALPEVQDYIEPASSRKAPATYKKAESIVEWQAEDLAKDIDRAGLDLDLARIIGFGYLSCNLAGQTEDGTMACRDDAEEHQALVKLSGLINNKTLVSFNGLHFDWPLLMRRARYRNVNFRRIDCDRYRSPHVDVLAHLSLNDPSRRKSLAFYVRRMGWRDLSKPLSGAEESKVPQTGKWDELILSMQHDVEATYRLAVWAGLL